MKKRTMSSSSFFVISNLILVILFGLLAGCPRKHQERSATAPVNPPAVVLNVANGATLRAKVTGLTVTVADQASGAVVAAQTFADPTFPLNLTLEVTIPPCFYTITAAAVLRDGSTNSASASVDACALAGEALTLAIVTEEPPPTPTTIPTAIPTIILTVIPIPTAIPTNIPTVTPLPTAAPTNIPTVTPLPTAAPTNIPTVTPIPTAIPTNIPTVTPTVIPIPTATPTETPVPPVPTATPTETPAPPVPTATPTETPAPPVPTATPTETPAPPTPTPTATIPPSNCTAAGPVSVGGYSWYLGMDGQSCATICGTYGLGFDNATETYAGQAGSLANCDAVLTALAAPGSGTAMDVSYAAALGCGYNLETFIRFRNTFNAATADGAALGACRACACAATPSYPTICTANSPQSAGGYSWYCYDAGLDCNTVCSNYGMTFNTDPLAIDYYNADLPGCQNIITALGLGFTSTGSNPCAVLLGCHLWLDGAGNQANTCTDSPALDPIASGASDLNICPCL